MSAERKGLEKSSDEGEDAQEDPQVQPDSVLLQQFVPEEVWEHLSKKVLKKDSKDHQNLVNSSQFFRNIRASQRTTYLFEQVFPLVAKSVWKKEGLEGFPMRDVLKCRAVCKEVNAAIDQVLPQFTSLGLGYRDFEVNFIGRDLDRIKRNEFNWPDRRSNGYMTPGAENSVQDFMQYFEPTHDPTNPSKARNPFIWGKVELNISPLRHYDNEETVAAHHRYLQGVTSMLSKYGKLVHSFKLVSGRHVFEILLLLREWLLQMPNLKELMITLWGCRFRQIYDFSFPQLRFLNRMVVSAAPPQVFNQLIQNNNHISSLFVEYPKDYNVFTVALPNIKEFGMDHCPDDIVKILASPQMQWPLESLELKRFRVVSFLPLFRVIQDKFADTIVSLSLQIRRGDSSFDAVNDPLALELRQYCKNCRLDLPKLKKIWLCLDEIPVCLDFLLPMKNQLEEIAASCDRNSGATQDVTSETSGTVVQFSGFEWKMLESNIWSIFNKLEKFEALDRNGAPFRYFRSTWMLRQ